MGNKTCNCEIFKDGAFVECGKPAEWEHPRWPDGLWCGHCRKDILVFFPMSWTRIKENEDGR